MQPITDIDFIILDFLREKLSCGFLDTLMPVITFLGNADALWIAVSLVLLFIKRYRKNAVMVLGGLGCCTVIGNLILKNLVARARPCHLNTAVHLLVSVPRDYSFPSGHTMASFAAAVILYRTDKRLGIPAFVLAFLIAFSRLYLYVHFPSDVISGALIGTATGYAVWLIGNKITGSRSKQNTGF